MSPLLCYTVSNVQKLIVVHLIIQRESLNCNLINSTFLWVRFIILIFRCLTDSESCVRLLFSSQCVGVLRTVIPRSFSLQKKMFFVDFTQKIRTSTLQWNKPFALFIHSVIEALKNIILTYLTPSFKLDTICFTW